jgi:hypothetical protein
MSANPEVDGIVTLPFAEEPAPLREAPVPEAQPIAAPTRKRTAWVAPVAIAAIGVLASGTLGYFLYATMQQRDGLQTRLAAAQEQLQTAQADAAGKEVTATYVAMYVADNGKVATDYEEVVNCATYTECRTAAQQLLSDLQSFQADRKAANVPSDLASTDSSAGDALSAAIAGDQEFIVGMDNGDVAKIKEGGNKVDAAMLSLGKAQAALGTILK